MRSFRVYVHALDRAHFIVFSMEEQLFCDKSRAGSVEASAPFEAGRLKSVFYAGYPRNCIKRSSRNRI